MADTLRVLGQSDAPGGTLTDLYAVPEGKSASVSSVVVCNRTAESLTFRVAVAVAAAVDEFKQYLYYDLPLKAHDTFIATIGVTLGALDVVRVQSPGGVTFSAFGVEVTS